MTAGRGKWFWALATAAQGAGAQGVEEAIATETNHTNEAATPAANTWTAFTTVGNKAVIPTGGLPFSVDVSAKIATGVGTLSIELEGIASMLPKGTTAEWAVLKVVPSHTFAATATQEWENSGPIDAPGIQFVRWSRYQCTVANALSVFNGRILTTQ